MAYEDIHVLPNQSMTLTNSNKRLFRHKIPLRRRKVPTVHLGGKKPRRGVKVWLRMFRRIRLKWLKLQYMCMLRKVKEYYKSLVKELSDLEAGANFETFQQRLLLETSFAIPVMGISFSTFPTVAGSDRLRALVM